MSASMFSSCVDSKVRWPGHAHSVMAMHLPGQLQRVHPTQNSQQPDGRTLTTRLWPLGYDFPPDCKDMLPEFLEGSFHRYKADTTAFITWLAEIATRNGVVPSYHYTITRATPEYTSERPISKRKRPGRISSCRPFGIWYSDTS